MKKATFLFQSAFLALLFLIPLHAISQQSSAKNSVKGKADVISQNRKLGNFHSIVVSSGIDLYLSQGDKQKVEVRTDENLQEKIITQVKNGTLKVYSEKWIKGSKSMDVYVTVTELRSLSLSGGTDVTGETPIKADNFNATVNGGSDLELNLNATNTNWQVSGGSDIDLTGSANSLELKISGGSDFDAPEFKVSNCDVVASGASDVEVNVSDKLSAILSGASDLTYSGNPSTVNKQLSGASDISKE